MKQEFAEELVHEEKEKMKSLQDELETECKNLQDCFLFCFFFK